VSTGTGAAVQSGATGARPATTGASAIPPPPPGLVPSPPSSVATATTVVVTGAAPTPLVPGAVPVGSGAPVQAPR
jgi:hypothetical protein